MRFGSTTVNLLPRDVVKFHPPLPKAGDAVTVANVYPGLVIARGADWQWADQDAGNSRCKPHGVVLCAHPDDPMGWCKVRWRCGAVFSYRIGWQGKHDLQYADLQPGSPVEVGRDSLMRGATVAVSCVCGSCRGSCGALATFVQSCDGQACQVTTFVSRR